MDHAGHTGLRSPPSARGRAWQALSSSPTSTSRTDLRLGRRL